MSVDSIICSIIATELQVKTTQVQAAVKLLDEGATVAFISRYRKEATGSLTDEQMRLIEERLAYLRELEQRRQAILKSIDSQGKLTTELQQKINQASSKQQLEDLYLPYKPKRHTKAQIAREAGLEDLAQRLWQNPQLVPQQQAQQFIQAKSAEIIGFDTVELVLDAVQEILAEQWSETAELLQVLRNWLWQQGVVQAKLKRGQDVNSPEVAKFSDYFTYQEPIHRVPSHRALALFRANQLGILNIKLTLAEYEGVNPIDEPVRRIAQQLNWRNLARAADPYLQQVIQWTWQHKLSGAIERDLLNKLKDSAQTEAIRVFADNLRNLLLSAPAGAQTVLGLDPGIRTGVKVAVVAASGEVLATTAIYPHQPRNDWQGSLQTLASLIIKHKVQLIAIGNGTASRETDKLAAEVIKLLADAGKDVPQRLVISEAGASVYSASAYAGQELPQLDVTLRGAVSIARRLQDPLAELVKIEPKAIGVGQYQHDVNQQQLARSLVSVVEDCVNAVGVDLNTASVPLLQRVSGLSLSTAKSIVEFRQTNGGFKNRQQLLKVAGLGAKTFEQSAGFLRILAGDNALDMTGVHPESYPIVTKIVNYLKQPIQQLIGKPTLLANLPPSEFTQDNFGEISVKDILQELSKPNRDPRPNFKVARFNDGVDSLADLKVGMVLQGTVSNVAAFGAFVDLGVHQDGLVHISQISKSFVKDARDQLKVGQQVKVRVVEIDLNRKRIALSMLLDSVAPSQHSAGSNNTTKKPITTKQSQPVPINTAMANAFSELKSK